MRSGFEHVSGIERIRIAPTPPDFMRLHRLERPERWPSVLIDEMQRYPGPNLYPDYAPFIERLREFIERPVGKIVLGQGIEGLIRDLVMLYCGPGDGLAFTAPTCAMFGLYGRIFGADVTEIVLDPNQKLDVFDLVKQIKPGIRLFILPQPGQPVDDVYHIGEMVVIAERCLELGAVLAIDQAYLGFGNLPRLDVLLENYPNVVLLRTFSKALGGASLRVGYCFGSDGIIDAMDGVRQSGEISGPSLHAANVLLDYYESYVRSGIAEVVAGRDYLVGALTKAGFKARGQNANHVLIDLETKEHADATAAALKRNRVMVRHGMPHPLDNWLMVTCGSPGLMKTFFEIFRESVR